MFRGTVPVDFVEEYRPGWIPNPCARRNEHIKLFGQFARFGPCLPC